MSKIIIRDIAQKDNQIIQDIVINTLAEFGAVGDGFASSDAELKDMYSSYQDSRKHFFVVEKDGVVLGGAGVAPLDGQKDLGVCELRKMYFDNKLRGYGVGKILIDKCIAKAREIGFHSMYLETIPGMKIAQKLYKSRGFEYLKSSKGNTCHHACQVFMLKKLNGHEQHG